MLPDWDEDEEEDEGSVQDESSAKLFGRDGRAEDFLEAWDPSMYSDEEWDL